MSTFKCPICKDIHRVNNRYDQQDYDCPSTHLHKRRQFQDQKPDDIMSRNAYNWNSRSTRVDEHRSVTVIPAVLKSDQNKITKSKTRRSYNW